MEWQELENESTSDLIDFVKSKSADKEYEELAQAAFIVITFRFREDILKKCQIMIQKWKKHDNDAIELANRVFERFYKYPQYDNDWCKSGNTDRCFVRYLYGIANKEIVSMYNPYETPYDGDEKIVTTLIGDDTEYEEVQLKELKLYEEKLDAIFAKLTSKHKIIYLTYKKYEQDGYNLPRHLTKALRESLQLTQSSIRVYKNEAFELVQKELANG